MSTTKREAVYDEQIFGLMARVIEIAKANGIPMVAWPKFAAFAAKRGIVLPPPRLYLVQTEVA